MKIINKNEYKHTVINLRKYHYILFYDHPALFSISSFSAYPYTSLSTLSPLKTPIQKYLPKVFHSLLGGLQHHSFSFSTKNHLNKKNCGRP